MIVFGTGRAIRSALDNLISEGYKVEFFVDNDKKKQKKTFLGYPVKSPRSIIGTSRDIIILIGSTKYQGEIVSQLIDLGEYYNRECYTICDIEYRILSKKYYCQPVKSFRKKENDIAICYDSQIFSLQNNGGISRYYYENISHISKMKDISVNFFQGINNSVFQFNSNDMFLNCYYSKHDVCYSKNGIKSINAKLFRDFVDLEEFFDIYHPSYYNEYGVSNYKKLVVTVHDMINELYCISDEESRKKKRIVDRADAIIAVSESTKQDLIRVFDVPENKIRVIYEGNSLCYEVKEASIVDGLYILYVGKRSGYKNAELLIRSFAKSKLRYDYKLVFMGGGDFSVNEKEMIDKLGIANKIMLYHGDDKVLANLYNYADFFVYPSKYEGFGIPILESMHYGTPVITADSSSTKEVASDAALLFDPESEESLIHAMESMAGDQEKKNGFKKRGILRENYFSWEKSANDLVDYYRDILKS